VAESHSSHSRSSGGAAAAAVVVDVDDNDDDDDDDELLLLFVVVMVLNPNLSERYIIYVDCAFSGYYDFLLFLVSLSRLLRCRYHIYVCAGERVEVAKSFLIYLVFCK